MPDKDKEKEEGIVTHGIMGGYRSPFGAKDTTGTKTSPPDSSYSLKRIFIGPPDSKNSKKMSLLKRAAVKLLGQLTGKG
jgi:hypothetical protein